MNNKLWKSSSILGLALVVVLVVATPAWAAKGGIPGPPTGGETANNLSLPGIRTESVDSTVAYWATPAEPVLAYINAQGELIGHYSYGCDQPEGNPPYSYPNTSCVDNLDAPTVYYTAEECVAPGAPCDGLAVSRIYWQKVDVNEWWADDDGISPDSAEVAYVDWGDALEAVSWTTKSKVRVETQPYSSTIPGYLPWVDACADAASIPAQDCKVGFQMWHVSGQGITEHWGVRATDDDDAVSYNYDSPFQIIKTSKARLDVAKMVPGVAECPEPGGGDDEGEVVILAGEEPPVVGGWNGSGWDGTCSVHNDPYSVETSVGGKYVYGYNLDMKVVDLGACPGEEDWEKPGYYRLTFYTEEDEPPVEFWDPATPNVAPPAVPSEVRVLPRCTDPTDPNTCLFNTATATPPLVTESDDPTADDRLYRPVIDINNNLTYIDICIVLKEQGGGGGGGGKKKK